MRLISLLALASSAHAGPGWPDLDRPPAAQPPGDDAALVVAIEDYAFLEDIPGARRNARAWQAWLHHARGIPLDRVRMLVDHAATDEAILEETATARDAVGPGGQLWVVFIGHGAPSPTDALLVGVDAQQTARGLQTRSVPRGDLLAAASAHAGDTVVVLDACFSGLTAAGPLVEGLMPMLAVAPPTTEAIVLSAYTRTALGTLLDDRQQHPTLIGEPGATLGWGREAGPDLLALARREPERPVALPQPAQRRTLRLTVLAAGGTLALTGVVAAAAGAPVWTACRTGDVYGCGPADEALPIGIATATAGALTLAVGLPLAFRGGGR